MKRTTIGVASLAVTLAMGGLALFAPLGSASAIHPPNTAGHVIDLGPSPSGVPTNCPFVNNDASFLTVGGNAVSHETTNKNGDWGGFTFEGTAIFQEAPYSGFNQNGPMDTGPPVQLYEGHLSYWNGGGNNAAGQSEGGATADFHGTAISGTGSINLHVNFHGTTNDAGNPTSNVTNVTVTCS